MKDRTKKMFATIKFDNWKKLKIASIMQDRTLSIILDEFLDTYEP